MGRNRMDEIGKKFGRLTIIEDAEDGISPSGTHYRIVKFKCECGNIGFARLSDIKKGNTTSCGCYKDEFFTKHGFDKKTSKYKRIYNIYLYIKKRCYNRNCKSYNNYGGRGIIMCKDWFDNFLSFSTWSLNNGYSDNLTIDRINNNGIYEPNNCRWVDMKTQANNKRNNVHITKDGITMNLTQWCHKLGLNYGTYKSRRRAGWNIDKSLFKSVKHHKKS